MRGFCWFLCSREAKAFGGVLFATVLRNEWWRIDEVFCGCSLWWYVIRDCKVRLWRLSENVAAFAFDGNNTWKGFGIVSSTKMWTWISDVCIIVFNHFLQSLSEKLFVERLLTWTISIFCLIQLWGFEFEGWSNVHDYLFQEGRSSIKFVWPPLIAKNISSSSTRDWFQKFAGKLIKKCPENRRYRHGTKKLHFNFELQHSESGKRKATFPLCCWEVTKRGNGKDMPFWALVLRKIEPLVKSSLNIFGY